MFEPRFRRIGFLLGLLFAILSGANAAGFGHSDGDGCSHCATLSATRRRYDESVSPDLEAFAVVVKQSLAESAVHQEAPAPTFDEAVSIPTQVRLPDPPPSLLASDPPPIGSDVPTWGSRSGYSSRAPPFHT